MTLQKQHQVELPEYRPLSFHRLWKLLGESDSGLEWLEVACRELILLHETDGADGISALAIRHGINVNAFDALALRTQWARLQVTTVAQYVELFLDNFRGELARPSRDRNSGEDLVTYTLDIYKVKRSSVGELQCDLLDYYRKLRNHLVHESEAEAPKMLVRRAHALRKLIEAEDTPYSQLSAPNSPTGLTFDDFVLFTRAVKDFSKRLCANIEPTIQEMQSRLAQNERLLSALRRQNSIDRRTKLLANYVRNSFGFNQSAESIAAALFDEGLLAQR